MEVKDLIKSDLTEDQLKQLELDERKDKYKKLQHYLQSEEFKTLCIKYNDIWEQKSLEIKKLLKERKETKSTKSQLDKDVEFQYFLEEILKDLSVTDWEEILKQYFKEQIEAIDTNLLNKVSHEEELYDVPFYTQIDIEKQIRMDYCTFEKRVRAITASFADKTEEASNPNPYEEWPKMTEDEFNALTDIN